MKEPHHPAVLRALMHVAEVGREKGLNVAVCGEIAGDPHFTPLLVGLGINELSMASPLIPELKFFARRFSSIEAKELQSEVSLLDRPSLILRRIKAFHDEKMASLEFGED